MSREKQYMAIKSGPYIGPVSSFKGRATVSHNNRIGKKHLIAPRKQKTPVARGTNVAREIEFLQEKTDMLMPKPAFSRLVKEIAEEMAKEMGCPTVHKWKSLALDALQEGAEGYMTSLFADSNLLAMHARRVTLQYQDIELAQRLRGETNYRQLPPPPL